MEGEIMFEECINPTMKINVSIKFFGYLNQFVEKKR